MVTAVITTNILLIIIPINIILISIILCCDFYHLRKWKKIHHLKLRILSKPKGRNKRPAFFPSLSYLHSAEGSKQEPRKDKRGESHMERKLHRHKYTPTHHSKWNCLASSSFQSMNTPPPLAKRARQKKVEAEETEVLFQLERNFQ
jgi:hypothetical protein